MQHNRNRAILCLISSAFFFTCMNIFVRLSGSLPSVQKSFFRNLVAVVIAVCIMRRNGQHFRPQKKNLKDLFIRSAFGTIGILCNFYAVDHLGLADASVLNKMSPFFVLVFSFFILKEKLAGIQIGVVALAFTGSLFVIKPTLSNMQLVPSLIGLLGGAAAGLAYTMVRKLSLQGENGATIVLFFSAFSCLSMLPMLVLQGQPMTIRQLLCLLCAGLAAAGGQLSITAAYSYAPGREISVYDYSQILFGAVLGFLIFGDVPDGWSMIGYLLIIGAAIGIFIYNNYSKPEPNS